MDRAGVRRFLTSTRFARSLLAALLLLDSAMPFLGVGVDQPSILSTLVASCLFAQIGLHAVWFAVGRTRWYWRAASIPPAVTIAWWYVHRWPNFDPDAIFLRLCVSQWAFVVVTLAAMRLMGFLSMHVPAGKVVWTAQYSMRDLVVFVTLTALLVGAVLRVTHIRGYPDNDWVLVAIVGGFFGLTTLLPAIAVLAMRRPLLPIGFGLLASAGLGVGLVRWLGPGNGAGWTVSLFLTPAAMQTAVLLFWRWQGWQIRRVSRAIPPAAAAPLVESDAPGL